MKEEKNVKRIKSLFFIIIVVLLIAITYKTLEIIYLNVELDEQNNIISGYNTTSTENVLNYDSVQISKSVESKEQEKMKQLGIAEENLSEVVIKNGDIYNYEKFDEFYNKFLVAEGIYQNEANETLKIVNYKDDTTIDEIVIHIETRPKNEILYEGTVTITVNGNSYEKDYYLTPFWRMPVKDDEGELFIEYYFFNDGNRVDLFKYRLSSTSYLGTIEFRFSENEEEKLVKYPVQDAEGKAKTISVVGGVLTVLERGATEPVFLQEAIESGVLTYDRILKIADADSCYGKCQKDMFRDGGSVVYEYADFVIYEVNSFEREHGIVFASKSMTLDQAKNWVDPGIIID